MTNLMINAPVALAIFITTIIVSLSALFVNRGIYDAFILRPYDIARGRRYYSLLTSGLIHADITHLLFNMISYFFFAFVLESRIGHWQFAVLYIVTLILSDVPSVIRNRNNSEYASLGASGAISAVIFSYILYNPLNTIYIYAIPLPAILYAVLYLGYCIFASRKQFDNVNHSAHFWGAVFGMIITVILDVNSISIFLNSFKF
jgi:membrane associated rhomboid family serine protease